MSVEEVAMEVQNVTEELKKIRWIIDENEDFQEIRRIIELQSDLKASEITLYANIKRNQAMFEITKYLVELKQLDNKDDNVLNLIDVFQKELDKLKETSQYSLSDAFEKHAKDIKDYNFYKNSYFNNYY